MRNGYLEYYQLILQKVSFDQRLFMKEYHKALKFLKQHEAESLHQWIRAMGLQELCSSSLSQRPAEDHAAANFQTRIFTSSARENNAS